MALLWTAALSRAGAQELALSAEEKTWVAQHRVIRVGYDPNWPPFSLTDASGAFVGMDADLLALLGRRLGVRFVPVPAASWPDAYRAAQHGAVDLLVGTARTPERERDFHFTEPYVSFPVGIVTRSSEDFYWSALDLEGRTVASPRGYVTTEALVRDFPRVKLRLTDSVADSLELVTDGQADAAITNLVNASYIIKTRGFSNLKISGVLPDTFELRYAVRQDWPELVRVLDRAIASLSRAEVQTLHHRWVRVDYAKVIRWDLVWKTAASVLAVLGAVIGFLVWHYRAVRVELAKRKIVQQALEAANTRLNVANAELITQHEEISELMRVAAHDLRSPLTAITLGADMFRETLAGAARAQAESMLGAARQMMQLIDDLLEVHALEQGQRRFEFVETDVAALVRESVAALEPLARRKGMVLDLTDVGAPPLVKADGRALRQALENLLSNAFKFSPPGGIVRVRAFVWNEFVRVEVIDQGPGVPPNERERIFTKYARGTARPTGGEKSTGLGLAIVRETISVLNGRTWCQEAPLGRGACFVIVVPFLQAEESRVAI